MEKYEFKNGKFYKEGKVVEFEKIFNEFPEDFIVDVLNTALLKLVIFGISDESLIKYQKSEKYQEYLKSGKKDYIQHIIDMRKKYNINVE